MTKTKHTTQRIYLAPATIERMNQIGEYIESLVPGVPIRHTSGEFVQISLFEYVVKDWVRAIRAGSDVPVSTLNQWTEDFILQVYAAPNDDQAKFTMLKNPSIIEDTSLIHDYLLANIEKKGLFITRRGTAWSYICWMAFKRMSEKIAERQVK